MPLLRGWGLRKLRLLLRHIGVQIGDWANGYFKIYSVLITKFLSELIFGLTIVMKTLNEAACFGYLRDVRFRVFEVLAPVTNWMVGSVPIFINGSRNPTSFLKCKMAVNKKIFWGLVKYFAWQTYCYRCMLYMPIAVWSFSLINLRYCLGAKFRRVH